MSRLGIYAEKINAIREQREFDASGFRLDGTDPARGDKEAMLQDMYRRADSHLPPGIGGPSQSTENVNPQNDTVEGESQEDAA